MIFCQHAIDSTAPRHTAVCWTWENCRALETNDECISVLHRITPAVAVVRRRSVAAAVAMWNYVSPILNERAQAASNAPVGKKCLTTVAKQSRIALWRIRKCILDTTGREGESQYIQSREQRKYTKDQAEQCLAGRSQPISSWMDRNAHPLIFRMPIVLMPDCIPNVPTKALICLSQQQHITTKDGSMGWKDKTITVWVDSHKPTNLFFYL